MANGKIMDRNHITEEKSLRFLQDLFPVEWIPRKMVPDYGIDIDLELFDYEEDVCVTLGEHVFLQVKGTESPNFTTINPIGEQLYTNRELEGMQVPVLKFVLDVPLLKLVERMGSTTPVLLIVVDLTAQEAYYVCLNDYVRNVLFYHKNDYRKQDKVTIYIPKENILKPEVASWYGKRAKLYSLFQELLTLVDDVRLYNANHKVDAVAQRLKMIALSDAWSVCEYWYALKYIHEQLREMLENNMLNKAGKHLLDGLADKGENPETTMVQYGNEPIPVSALLAAQATSCNAFLDQAKATSAMFENNVRHMGLPTQINWMLSH